MQLRTFTSGIALMLAALHPGASCFAAAPRAYAQPQVEIHGHAGANERVVQGGRHVALRLALAQIVPHSYSINLPNAGSWADTLVSWGGRESLADAIGEIVAVNPRLVAQIDTDMRVVTVTERASAFDAQDLGADADIAPAEVVASATSAAPSAPPAPAPAAQPAVHAPPPVLPPALAKQASAEDLISRRPPLLASSLATAPAAPTALPAHTAASLADTEVVVAAPPPAPARTWRVELSDRTIKGAMERWAKEAGWQFIWDVPTDFAVDASASVSGSLEDALHAVVQALQRSQVPIQVILYKGNRVLRVVAEGAA